MVPETQWPDTEDIMRELSSDSEVTFRKVIGSAEVLPTRPGVDPLEVTRPLADLSWATQSPVATSPSVLARSGTQPPAESHVFGPLTTQVGSVNPPRADPTSRYPEPAPLHYNGAQRYEQSLQVGRLYRALILLGLAVYLSSASVSSSWRYIYIVKTLFAYILLFTF